MEYKTKNFYLSVILLYLGAELVHIEEDENNKKRASYFVFTGNFDYENIEKQYYGKELKVEPNKLFFCFKELKTRLFDR